jgi:hypothetical protein
MVMYCAERLSAGKEKVLKRYSEASLLIYGPAMWGEKNSLSTVLNSFHSRLLPFGMSRIAIFLVVYLTTPSVSRLRSVDDRIINKYTTFGGMGSGRGK